ncbi:MAG: hypothetical protein JWM95_919 [Gemmatimonadetes bacterium]|nr:hypothetical protein [Gemmatimonadota bacterium]
MRSSLRLAALAAVFLSAISCTEAPIAPASPVTMGHIGIAPSYSTSAITAYNSLAAFAVDVTSIHVHLTAPDGSVRDTTVAFPVSMEQISIDLAVPLRTAGQVFIAVIELRAADGTVLFSGTQNVTAVSSTTPGTGVSVVPVHIDYTGPGYDASTVAVSPATGAVTGTGTIQVTASAKTATGADVSNLLVRWTTSDATLATVTQTGNTTATVTTTGKRGSVIISAITVPGKTGTATFNLVPAPSRVVVISGGGQTGPAGTQLPQPLIVEVQAADNQPVPNAPVTFRAVTAGAVVSTSSAVLADASGRASVVMTLGPTPGANQFEAASGTLTPATATVTATAAPAASITIASGNFQTAAAGASVPQPLAARVLNRFGGAVAGATVTWATVSGTGSVGAATSTTDVNGIATTTYRVGTSTGVETVRASLTGIAAPAGETIFTVSIASTGPSALASKGGGQHALVGSALSAPLEITVTDAFGNPAGGEQVAWRVAAGNATATLTNTGTVTDADGVARTNVTLGQTAGPVTIIATVRNLSANFTVTADAQPNSGSPGTLSGYVYNAVSNAPLSGVTVTVNAVGSQNTLLPAFAAVRAARISRSQQCQPCGVVATTGSDGHFTTSRLASGDYDVSVSFSAFTSTVILSLHVDGNTVAEAVPLVPASTQPGSISGTIKNASTNQAISVTATVELRSGLNATAGAALQTTQTNGSGQYVFSGIAAGTYTVRVIAPGFATATKTGISVGAQTTGNQDVFVSATGAAGNVRIVLTWLASPRDLDSYLSGPVPGGGSFTVWYGNRSNCLESPYACLDQDVTGGYGPETITIARPTTGTYHYSVNQYSGDGSLGTSGARVDLYINNALARSFSVPAGSGRNWTVFDLDGTTITTINRLDGSNSNSESRVPSAARIRSSAGATLDAARIEDLKRSHPKP